MSLFNITRIYTVHINPSQAHATEKAVFIREGFNFTAFLIGTFWALYNKLWVEAFAIMSVLTLLALADKKDWLPSETVMVLNLAFNLFVGFMANDLRRNNLSRKGYIMTDVVVSDSELRAQQRYFDRVLAV